MTAIDDVREDGNEKVLEPAKDAAAGNRRFQVNFASACDANAISAPCNMRKNNYPKHRWLKPVSVFS